MACVAWLLALTVPIILFCLDRSPIIRWISLIPPIFWFGTAVYMASFADMPPPIFMVVPFLISVLPVWKHWSQAKKHVIPDHCPTCDYDLTSSVSGRCPECGRPVGRDAKPSKE
jgi:hypothetical protein